jgi:hypothetical protein
MALTPPNDLSLHPLWNHAVSWCHYESLPVDDETINPLMDQFQNLNLVRPVLPYEFTQVPGLAIRWATEEDIPATAEVTLKGGNYPDGHPIDKMLRQAINDPLVWAMIWELDGQPIQFEAITLGPSETVYINYLVHFKRTYAQWVWGACETPVRDWLTERGYKVLRSMMRKERAAYRLERTKKVYDLKQIGEAGNYVRLEWALQSDTLPKFPARKTAGIGWEYTYKNVWFREMKDSELATVQDAIREMFTAAGLKNGDDAANLLAERYRLEKATVLLGFTNGKIAFVRTAREREPGQAAVANLNPLVLNNESRIMSYVGLMWVRLLGYTSAVMFIPAWQYRSPKMKAYLAQIAPYMTTFEEHPHYDGPVYEVGIKDFDPVLKVNIESWA